MKEETGYQKEQEYEHHHDHEPECRHEQEQEHGHHNDYESECCHEQEQEHGHHHDHESECHHEHEQEHGHHHTHEPECDHDHEHAHHHHHGEECDHDHAHAHHHHHHHHHESEAFPSVSVTTHEIAVVGSVRCRIDGSYEEALDVLEACMKQTAQAVEAAGGMIGHVKAFAKEEARSCMISVTDGEDIQRKPAVGSGILVESANIVFGVTPVQLEEILRSAFQKFL